MDEIKAVLTKYKKIAVIGLSDRPDRPSCYVTEYMRSRGYDITPVNPQITVWQGLPCYPDLKSAPGPLEIVNIFRKPSDIPPLVDEAVSMHAKVIWMQSGIEHEEAAAYARSAGLTVIMNRCIMIEHRSRF